MRDADGGVYECRGRAGGDEVMVATKVQVVGHAPHSGCVSTESHDSGPTITGWFKTVMIQAGETARLACNTEVSFVFVFPALISSSRVGIRTV